MNAAYLEVIVRNEGVNKSLNFNAEKMQKDAQYRAFVDNMLNENKESLVSMCVVQRCNGQIIG